jgi:hypothetical protein
LTLEAMIGRGDPLGLPQQWEVFLHSAPNPLAPTLAEAVARPCRPPTRCDFWPTCARWSRAGWASGARPGRSCRR